MNVHESSTGSLHPRRPWLQFGHLRGFHWTKQTLAIPDLPASLVGLRILHITDTHIKRNWCEAHSTLLDRVQADPPDLILFTGDFVDAIVDPRNVLANLERFVRGLKSRLGVFSITGNHDGDLVGPRIEALGTQFINERRVNIESESGRIELIGLPGIRRRGFDPNWIETLPPRSAGVPRIVLAHFPDQVLLIKPLLADLMLSGHTHGGQICLPNGYAMLTHDKLPKAMAQGRWRVGDTQLIVSRGLGWTRWPVRIFCPAEVIEIELISVPVTQRERR